jgi:L-threonylcarbamoyladenylate synthase
VIILGYNIKDHAAIMRVCIKALRQGRTVVYPTDTSYGLACDVTDTAALNKLYKVKQRPKLQPTHIIPPSLTVARQLGQWNAAADRLAGVFWPGPLTLVLPLKSRAKYLQNLTGAMGAIGLRMPDNRIALDLAKGLGRPISAASANPSGSRAQGYDSYSADDVISTVVRTNNN